MEDLSALDEVQLLTAATAGSEEALGLLLFRLQPTLLAAIRPQMGNRLKRTSGEEDILQEAYRRAFVGFDRADFANDGTLALEPFVRWLQQIATNCVRESGRAASAKKRGGDYQRVAGRDDDFRGQAQDLLTELSTGDATVSQVVAKAEASEALRVAIAGLAADQQQAIRLRYFDKCSVEEVAEQMQRSQGSVRGLLDRARAALRVAMHNSAMWLSRRD